MMNAPPDAQWQRRVSAGLSAMMNAPPDAQWQRMVSTGLSAMMNAPPDAQWQRVVSTGLSCLVFADQCQRQTSTQSVMSVQVRMQNDYNEFSDLQSAGGVLVAAAMERYAKLALKAAGPLDGKFVVTEYGCSTGGNSILPIATVCSAVCMPVLAIMNDRPQNNWELLTETLRSGLRHEGLEIKNAPGSMFAASTAPPASVHLGYTNYACHWLKQCPSNFTERMWANQRPPDATDLHRQKWSAQSAEDLANLLRLRAEEIAPGGIFLLGVWASDDGQFIMNSYELMADAKEKMLMSEQIDQEMATRLCMPEYARTVGEVSDVLRSDGHRDNWLIRECCTQRVDCNYQQDLQAGRIGLRECANRQMMSSRVVYDYFVVEALGPKLAEDFWQIVEDLSASDSTGNAGSTAHVYNMFVLQRQA